MNTPNMKDIKKIAEVSSIPISLPRKKSVGRPLFSGQNEAEVVVKLEYAFSIGAKPVEACLLANISKDSFYRYCKKNPEFRNRIELLQSATILMARKIIADELYRGNNVKLAWLYLERKCPEEFSPRVVEQYQLKKKTQRIEYLEELLWDNDIDFN